jgi:hypothetical protein
LVSDYQNEIRQLEALPADVDKLREWKKSRSEDVKQYLKYIDKILPETPDPQLAAIAASA